MRIRSGTPKVFFANVLAVFVVILPSLSEPLAAWIGPLLAPAKCSGSTISLISGDATLTLENPQISNASSYGCDVSGAMRIQLAGNNVGNIAIQGRVDAYDKFTSTSIDYFALEVAGLALKVYNSSFADGKLLLTRPKIKIPDSWGGLEAQVPKTFEVDSSGLKGVDFSLPSISNKKKTIELKLRGSLGLYTGGYKIHAEGSLSLPSIGKGADCGIGVSVTLYVDTYGYTVMEIQTPRDPQMASLAVGNAASPLPAGQAALIPVSLPAQSAYLPGAPPDDLGPEPASQAGTAAPGAPLLLTGPPTPAEPRAAPTGWDGLVVDAEARCERGIPIGTTGFQLTAVDGTITLMPEEESVRLAVTFESMLKVLNSAALTAWGQVLFQWSPEFAMELAAQLKVLEIFDVGGAVISVSESDGFRATVWWSPLWPPIRADLAVHAWSTTVGTCTAWDTWCIDPELTPPICDSECINWAYHDKFHFTGSASCQVGAEKGHFWRGCILPYPCRWRWCKAWFLRYPCFDWCWTCLDIPPWDIWLGGAGVEFGEFTGGFWGLKGTVTVLGFTTGFYIDHEGNFDFGDVSGYRLIDALRFAMAKEAWRAARLSDEPDAVYANDETFTFLSDDQVQVHFELPLSDPYKAPIGITDLISPLQIITQTDTIFSAKADVPLTVTLLTPDGFEITPDNYASSSPTYTVEYTQATSPQRMAVPPSSDENTSHWRFVPASDLPEFEHIDVRLDGTDVYTNVYTDQWFGDEDGPPGYLTVTTGVHTVEIVPVGASEPAATATLDIVTGTDYTVLAIGNIVPEAWVIVDDNQIPPGDSVGRVRVVNLAPMGELVDVSLGDWSFQDVAYKEATDYQVVAAGPYSLTASSAAFEPSLAITLTNGEAGFGYKVATAGDVNGDGYDDLLVGNFVHDGNRGKAYLYLGSPGGLTADLAWSASGENYGDRLGEALASAGDVNGDGYGDVVVGAHGYDSSRGKAYLYLGSADGLGATAAWTASGENTGDHFGISVAGAGDVDGHGYDDVLVGAYQYDDGGSTDAGRVYLYMGSPTGLSFGWTPTGNLADSRSGHTATGGMVVGGMGAGGYLSSTETYYGGTWFSDASLNTARTRHTATEGSWGENHLLVAGGLGDSGPLASTEVYGYWNQWWPDANLNTARYDHTATLLADGRVLVAGGMGTGGELTSTEVGPGTWSPTGSLHTARSLHTETRLPDGQVLVAGGQNAGTPLASAEVYSPTMGTWTETGLLNTARYSHTATLLPDGQVLVVGGWNGGPLASAEVYDPATGLWTEVGSLHTARDSHTATPLPAGRVLVAGGTGTGGGALSSVELYDPAKGLWTEIDGLDTARRGHTASSLSGSRVLIAGGLDGGGPLNSAEVYGPLPAGWTATGENNHDALGVSVAGVGDVNGDGFDDVVVGANGYPSGDGERGKVYLYHGAAAGLPVTPSWTVEGQESGYELGVSAAGAGDVNGDGYDDVLVGARGKAFLYMGSPTGTYTETAWTAAAESEGDEFGFSVAGTGDVNGDGYDDVLVGAYGYPGGANRGKATLYHGSATGLSPDWTVSSDLIAGRQEHTATPLLNGRVLVAGGQGTAGYLTSAELYDPATDTLTTTGSLESGRSQHTATRLADGRVLVAGGLGAGAVSQASAEIYDPATGAWTPTGSMSTARRWHAAVLLPNHKVLVAGGLDDLGTWLDNAELYDPATGTWTPTDGNMTIARIWHTATLLPNGLVLVAGHTAELYDPDADTWTATGPLIAGRERHTATLRPDGKVLVVGGWGAGGFLSSAEVYDPTAGTWSATGSLAAGRMWHSASLLPDGTALVAGGENTGGQLASAEVWDPATGAWSPATDLTTPREYHTATRLPGDRLLVAGGTNNSDGYLSSIELYHAPATWSVTGIDDQDSFGISVAGAGDVDGSGYSDLVIGSPGWDGQAYVYYGGVGVPPTHTVVYEGDVQTLVVRQMDGSPDPLVHLQMRDEQYRVFTETQYIVDQAITGTWSLSLTGDTDNAQLTLAAVQAHNPPILTDLTVDASDLANTLVTWRLTGDYLPVYIRIYANDGPISETVGITEPETIPLYQGVEVATIPISDDLAVRGATITATVDLSMLESGDYKLWVRVEDPVNPPVQGYVWGVQGEKSGAYPRAWNRVRIAAEDYDPLRQLEGAVVIPIDHSATFTESWTASLTPTLQAAGLSIEFTPHPHPDVDGYILEVSEAGVTHAITVGKSVYYHYDQGGEPIGPPILFALFDGLTPQETYTIRVVASDQDRDALSWSQERLFTVPLGDFALSALNPTIELPAGEQVVTATLVLTMTEDLFSDVKITLDTYHLPPGIAAKEISYEPLGVASRSDGIPAPRRWPLDLRAQSVQNWQDGGVTVWAHVALTVTQDVLSASYLLPFVAYSGELERQAGVRLLVGEPQEVIVDPGATEPVLLPGDLPLPSCATAILVTIPPGAFAVPAVVQFRQGSSNVEDWPGARFAGSHFTLTARDAGSGAPVEPLTPLSLLLEYDPTCQGGLIEAGLHLRYWKDRALWSTDGISCTLKPAQDALSCNLSNMGEFAMFESTTSYLYLYLPLVLKNK